MGEEIEIVVTDDAKLTVEVHGVVGGKCEEMTRPYESAFLGSFKRKVKPERYAKDKTAVRAKSGK